MSSKTLKPTGKQIRKLLVEREMTQKALANALGISHYYVRDICNDHRRAVVMRQRIYQYLKGDVA